MRFSAIFLAASLLTGACGGKVVIDGAEGTPPGGTGGTGSTGNVDPAICEALCGAMEARDCGSPGCVANCVSALAGGCQEAFAAAVACQLELIGPYNSCPIQGPCDEELLAYQACLAPAACTKTVVAMNEAHYTCFSRAECPAGEVRVDCDNQTYECACFVGNDLVGTCHEDGPLDCNLYAGCCAPLLFPPGG